VKYNSNGQPVALKKREYKQYGNPLGVYHQGFEDPDKSVFLANMVTTLLTQYDGDVENMRRIAAENHLNIEVVPKGTPEITLTQPIGVLHNLKISIAGQYRRMPTASVEFAFEPPGKEPLYCVGRIPYQRFSDGLTQQNTYLPMMAGLWCKLDGKFEQVATNTEEVLIEDYMRKRAMANRGSPIAGGVISAFEPTSSDFGTPGGVNIPDPVFIDTSRHNN
jgi:hypothetical protein